MRSREAAQQGLDRLGALVSTDRPFEDLPAWFWQLVIPLAFGVITLRSARQLVAHLIATFRPPATETEEAA